MPLDMEVGLSPGVVVLDRDPAPHQKKKGAQPPIFGPCLLWPNSWMDQGATWYRGRPWHRPHCVRWGPRSTHNGTPPNSRPTSVVAKWSPISATAVHVHLMQG